jgi:hypothetical protein
MLQAVKFRTEQLTEDPQMTDVKNALNVEGV